MNIAELSKSELQNKQAKEIWSSSNETNSVFASTAL